MNDIHRAMTAFHGACGGDGFGNAMHIGPFNRRQSQDTALHIRREHLDPQLCLFSPFSSQAETRRN